MVSFNPYWGWIPFFRTSWRVLEPVIVWVNQSTNQSRVLRVREDIGESLKFRRLEISIISMEKGLKGIWIINTIYRGLEQRRVLMRCRTGKVWFFHSSAGRRNLNRFASRWSFFSHCLSSFMQWGKSSSGKSRFVSDINEFWAEN